jgi:hypothetical protein
VVGAQPTARGGGKLPSMAARAAITEEPSVSSLGEGPSQRWRIGEAAVAMKNSFGAAQPAAEDGKKDS